MSKFFALIILNVLLIAAYVNAAPPQTDEAASIEATEVETTTKKHCEEICVEDLNKVCGYNGNCYKEYPNKCRYDYIKCSEKNNLETVDTSLCELAEKDNHPNFKLCSN